MPKQSLVPVKRQRRMFKFWLDMNDQTEAFFGHHLDELRASRQQKVFLLRAIYLFWSLKQGQVHILLALFPNIESMLHDYRWQEQKNQRGE